MKMKKSMLYSLMASVSMVSVAAYADDNTTLTTKNYVDSGLRAVYKAANEGLATKASQSDLEGVDGRVQTLESTVGDTTGGLVADVATLKGVIGSDDYTSLTEKIESLESVVGDNESGLVKQVSTLQTEVNYTGENGITVNNRSIGLAIENAVADTPYVYQNGTWSALETVDEWNPNILN